MPILRALAAAMLVLLTACGSPERAVATPEQLAQRLADTSSQQIALRASILDHALERLVADHAAQREPILDVLVLSGGGMWGAFGTGYMRGWAELPADHPLAMPEFDIIAGVSTGALIAPYAALGTPEALIAADSTYRDVDPDWAVTRSFAILPNRESLIDTTGLDAVLRERYDAGLARELVRLQREEHRQVVVTSSDLELGRPVTWRLGDRAAMALRNDPYDPDPLFRPLRASAAIPGAFTPIEIDGSLHADGVIYGQITVIGDPAAVVELVRRFRERAGVEAPMPRLRFWVILNNRTHGEATTIQLGWTSIAVRSLDLMFKESVAGPLNRLALLTDLIEHRHGIPTEMRWVAIPDDHVWPEVETEFTPELTVPLSDLGMALGRDPSSWRSRSDLGVTDLEFGRD